MAVMVPLPVLGFLCMTAALQYASGDVIYPQVRRATVFSPSQLGLWRTTFTGDYTGSRKWKWPAGAVSNAFQNPTSLEYWWRLRCSGDGGMHFRGVGSAYSSLRSAEEEAQAESCDSAEYGPTMAYPEHSSSKDHSQRPCGRSNPHALLPPFSRPPAVLPDLSFIVPANQSRIAASQSLRSPKSRMDASSANIWHVEKQGLSTAHSYLLHSSLARSSHAEDTDLLLDKQKCSEAPAVFKPGTIWTVFAESYYLESKLQAQLLVQHTRYHQGLGTYGSILVVSNNTAEELLLQPDLLPFLQAGQMVMIVHPGDYSVPSKPYYYQPLWYNLVLLATWGTRIKLFFTDPDEYYVLPASLTFTKALQPGGCLHGFSQVRITRHNIIFEPKAPVHPTTEMSSNSSSSDTSTPPAGADIYALGGDGGWRALLGQRYYIDAAPALGARWSHKALVDPNLVSWFDVHEGQVLPGGTDSMTAVNEACGFGLHVVNMFKRRTMGSGRQLHIGEQPFMLSEHWERVALAM